jgi:hypothetical protein
LALAQEFQYISRTSSTQRAAKAAEKIMTLLNHSAPRKYPWAICIVVVLSIILAAAGVTSFFTQGIAPTPAPVFVNQPSQPLYGANIYTPPLTTQPNDAALAAQWSQEFVKTGYHNNLSFQTIVESKKGNTHTVTVRLDDNTSITVPFSQTNMVDQNLQHPFTKVLVKFKIDFNMMYGPNASPKTITEELLLQPEHIEGLVFLRHNKDTPEQPV